ncbi:MAG: outer membrane beta-barrel protein [Nitrospira sp.]|nr:outer membrane beta-barrel protein [Nitrospira sp.]
MTWLQKAAWIWLFFCTLLCIPLLAQSQDTGPVSSGWHYGGFLDLGYAVDFNFPENHQWRSKTTTSRVNEFAPNMALAYVKKNISLSSPWGMELAVQAGYDTDGLVPQPVPERDKPISGADTLRDFSRANVSYLIPMGKGLVVTAGGFNSYIGYESIYAKYNLNYTRPYIADNAPYFMFGLRVRYPVSDTVNVGFYAINGYNYLSHINDQLSYGTQVAWK